MRDVVSCPDCRERVRHAETPDGHTVVLDAVPTSSVRERYSLAAPGRVVRTHEAIAFVLRQCAAPLPARR